MSTDADAGSGTLVSEKASVARFSKDKDRGKSNNSLDEVNLRTLAEATVANVMNTSASKSYVYPLFLFFLFNIYI